MRSLVTGGAGFIGSHLVEALVAAGDEVTIVDDLSSGRRENLAGALEQGARLIEADVRDQRAVREAFAAARPQRAFHLAAQISVRRSVAEPVLDADMNVGGTICVLEAARAAGVRRFVNASTGGPIYGPAPEAQLSRERDQPRPGSPYGQSKLAAEGFCELYRRLHGLSTVSLRYGNVYGPRQDPRGEAGVVAIFCARLLSGEPPIVFGDGHQARDFVAVGDVVAANLAAAAGEGPGPYNIATGTATSVHRLIEALGELHPWAGPPEHAPPRRGENRRTALDCSRAREELGWVPRIPLAHGLQTTLAAAGHQPSLLGR